MEGYDRVDFADCRIFAFRQNKFSRIRISDFTAGNKCSWIYIYNNKEI